MKRHGSQFDTMREARRDSRIAWIIGAIIALGVFGFNERASIVEAYENVALALAPSSERASVYGERHFDAGRPALYDIARAAYFY